MKKIKLELTKFEAKTLHEILQKSNFLVPKNAEQIKASNRINAKLYLALKKGGIL